MAVSAGFYKKIEQWVLDPQSKKISFQPFQANGNPYKANVFIVSAKPEPYLQIDSDKLFLYVHSLVSTSEFKKLFYEELKTASREYRGCINFMNWMQENYNETVILSYLNCLNLESTTVYKELKKQQNPLYSKGSAMIKELLNEFVPKIIIVQGTANWKQFLEQFGQTLIDVVDIENSVQQLETIGVAAKLPLANGEIVNVLACRSMGNFSKTGTSFGELKQTLTQLLQPAKNEH